MQASKLAKAVEEEFSGRGLEVQSTGASSLTVALPVEFADADVFFELAREYGAAVDFKNTEDGPQLEIYPAPATEHSPTWCVVIPWLLLVPSLALAASLLVRDVAWPA